MNRKTPTPPATIRNAADLRPAEIALLMRVGTDTGAGVTVLTRAAARAEIARLRREIALLERHATSRAAYRLDNQEATGDQNQDA